MTLAELRAEGQKLYLEVESFYSDNSRKIDSLRKTHDFETIKHAREELNRKQAEMLLANAKRFNALAESVAENQPELISFLRTCCADFLRSRRQMSKIGREFFGQTSDKI